MMLTRIRVNNQKPKRFQTNFGLSGSYRHKSLRPHIEGRRQDYALRLSAWLHFALESAVNRK